MLKTGCILIIFGGCFVSHPSAWSDDLPVHLQRRVAEPASSTLRVEQATEVWKASETAIVICDMWDRHWCADATERVAEMAPAMNTTLAKARDRGVLIIHAPSSTMKYYADTPQRKRAQAAAHQDMSIENVWQHLDPEHEGSLPVDDSDGGCDCDGPCPNVNQNVWSRQIETIEIGAPDYISDDGQEIFNVLKSEGRKNVILLGVHTNMCVLGRSFGIRAQVRNGMNVALLRDLTDTMYNPAMAPGVNHFRGTELVVQHIEQYWCPTMTSTDFTGEAPFAFAADTRDHAVFLIQENEYDSKKTLVAFAETELAQRRGWKCTYLFGNGEDDMPGLPVLADPGVDVMVVSMRRQVLPSSQLDRIRAYVDSGRPVAGIRTASHAFSLRAEDPPRPGAQWAGFDQEVLGGNYSGHHGNKGDDQPRTWYGAAPGAESHPILKGVAPEEQITTSWLYKVRSLGPNAVPLMIGRVEGREPDEPVAWVNTGLHGNRVFYTSLGHTDDFQDPRFRTMLENGLVWAAQGDSAEVP